MFIELAEVYFPLVKVREAWTRWLEMETTVLQELAPRGDRMH